MSESISQRPVAPISAIVATYNDVPIMLEEALNGVAQQTLMPAEIWVIDDGSEPKIAPEIIEKFNRETGLNAQYFWQANRGIASSRNLGIKFATQEFIAFHDADDRWLPNHLELLYKRMLTKDGSYSTVYDGFVEFEHSTGQPIKTIPCISYDGPIKPEMLGKPGGVPAGMPYMLHRRSALVEIGGFDEECLMSQDFLLLFTLGHAGYKISGSSEVTYWRRVHGGSHTRKNLTKTLVIMDDFISRAEGRGVITREYAQLRRKELRLNVGRRQVLNPSTVNEGIDTLRQAFKYGSPKGPEETVTRLLLTTRPTAKFAFGIYRALKNRGQK